MGIGHYIKDIGRGKDGARALSRAQAADLMGQVLDQQISDLELGAFCIAMRIKGETPEEMAGFLDATHARLNKVPTGQMPTVVLPSYNGARKLPVLTPLLALLLAREGVAVVMHGSATEDKRVSSQAVLAHLGIEALAQVAPAAAGQVQFMAESIPQAANYHKQGKVRALAVTSSERNLVLERLLTTAAHLERVRALRPGVLWCALLLAPLGGRPFITYLLDRLVAQR